MVVMHIFSLYWLLCNIVTFTSVTVLSYSEVILPKISFVQVRSPIKQANKYRNLVKQHKYTHTNTSVSDVFRTQLKICNGKFLRKLLTAFNC